MVLDSSTIKRKKFRYSMLYIIDYFFLVAASMWAGFLTFGQSGFDYSRLFVTVATRHVGTIIVLSIFGFYRLSVRHCSLDCLLRALLSVVCNFVFFITSVLIFDKSISSRLFANISLWSYFALVVPRVCYRMFIEMRERHSSGERENALIYGCGECGRALVRHAECGNLPYKIVGFIDDDPMKSYKIILNTPVVGTCDGIDEAIKSAQAKIVIVAIAAGLPSEKIQKVAMAAKHNKARVLMAPNMFDLAYRKKEFSLRTLDYEDLLGRDLITVDREPVENMVSGKVVLITGAGGTIGSEISRQLKTFNPAQLLLLDIDETELHNLSLELTDYREEFSQKVFPICCDIKNREKIREVFEKFRPNIVFHAAAYKHVPMMEMYPEEAIRTNISGSYNVLSMAKKYEAEKVIVISTDKAVNPTNVMGATKRVVEKEAAMLTSEKTPMVCVRFGNVLGSRGSMLPLFFDQIKNGKNITVTHKDIIRYFMAVPEAVGLVFRAGAMAESGEVMVLDMGEPVKIYDFAKRLIEVYGDPRKNKIVITGLRPGEKLYEELLANKDNTIPTTNDRIFQAKVENEFSRERFEKLLESIDSDSTETLVTRLKEVVPEFTHKVEQDWGRFALDQEQD